jgi:type IV secretion system protein VirB5
MKTTFMPHEHRATGLTLRMILKRSLGITAVSSAVFLSVGLLAPDSLRAGGLPVFDAAAITQMLQQSIQMAQQMETLMQQVGLLKQQLSSVTGHYGMGAIGAPVNGWGGTSWADISNMVGQGVNPGDAAQVQAYKRAQAVCVTQNPVLQVDLQTSNPRMNVAYSQTYSNGITGTALGESTYNQVNTYLADIDSLKSKIDQTDNLKAAMDLNTAVSIRVAQLNGEILRMQAAQLRLQAANQVQASNGYAAQAEFFAQ